MTTVPYDTILERIRERYVRDPEIVQRLRAESAAQPRSQFLLDAECGALLRTLARAVNPAKSLDIGVFTGFSSLTVAMEAPDARVIAQTVRTGWIRAVHVKSALSRELRTLLTARRLLVSKLCDVDNGVRGLLRGFGLKMGGGV